MLNKLNLKNVFFLSNNVEVQSLEEGAKLYGGATQFQNGVVVSGISQDNELIVNDKVETIVSLFIPSTLNVDEQIDNSKYVTRYQEMFEQIVRGTSTISYAKGSWMDNNDKVVVEKQTLISISTKLSKTKYNKLLTLARKVKREMLQEGVTLTIDKAFLIV